MDFTEEIKQFAQRVTTMTPSITNEESTKMSMIIPFFQLLGYDVFNPNEFYPEYTADIGIKKGEKVDYAILNNGSPEILIECKWCGESLTKHDSQLFRYFATCPAKFAILTNGLRYKFYTDLDEANKMDMTPFLEIDMANLRDTSVNALKKFCKDSFDKDSIFSVASELKYSSLIKDWLRKQSTEISDDFAKTILSDIYDGLKTQEIIDKFKPIIQRSFNTYISDLVNQKISSALEPRNDDKSDEVAISEEPKSKIITTEEELQAFYIIRAILTEEIPLDKIFYRDTESYFGILFDNNNRKPICRLNLDTKKKQLLIPDESKNFSRVYIDNIVEIYKYKQDLLASAKRYM